ncbi:hypothetical protein CBR_g4743 [Chara braunii]|uniref:Uncharacterized protein n=1 Tax=Chara braunii TaxID=69332 RepID=A0A388KIQ6_CHABU|nr:hypothetical protein CBR_g4743 [Chara braunii]|eukprot:GBG69916.1 hypothetical protein CBR_g4743 [Chara braunii]
MSCACGAPARAALPRPPGRRGVPRAMSAHPARVAAALSVAQSPFDGAGVSARASRPRCADPELWGERCGAGSSSSSSSTVIVARVGSSFRADVGYGAVFRAGKDTPAGGTWRDGPAAARCAIALRNRSGRSADAARRARSCRCMRSRGACEGGRLHARRAVWNWREEGQEKAIVEDRWRRDSRWDRRSVARRNHGTESVVVSLGEGVEERTGEETNPSGKVGDEAVENDKPASLGSRSRAGDPVLIVPGFLADAYEFVPLAEYLRSLGFNALAEKQWRWTDLLKEKGIEAHDKMTKETILKLLPSRSHQQMIELEHPFIESAPTAWSAAGLLKYARMYYGDTLHQPPEQDVNTDLTASSDMCESQNGGKGERKEEEEQKRKGLAELKRVVSEMSTDVGDRQWNPVFTDPMIKEPLNN